jgi:RNA polymerase sigma-70 factor (ECF subfamily)
LTSIVFLETWRKRNEVRIHGDSLLPWLYGVATNILRNRSRTMNRYRAALARLPLERQADFADDAAARIDDERQMRNVLDSFHVLPQRDQDVLALCVWSGLSYEEAALALDLPVGTVRSRLSRARRRLRDDTDGDGFSSQRRALAK